MKFTISSVLVLSLGVDSSKALAPPSCGIEQSYTQDNTVISGNLQMADQSSGQFTSYLSTDGATLQSSVTTLTEIDFLGSEYCNQMQLASPKQGEHMQVKIGTAVFSAWATVHQFPKTIDYVRLLYDRKSQSVNAYKCPGLTSSNSDCQHFWNTHDTTVYAKDTWGKLEWIFRNGAPVVRTYRNTAVRESDYISFIQSQASKVDSLVAENSKLYNENSKLNTEVSKYSTLKTDNSKLNVEVSKLNTENSKLNADNSEVSKLNIKVDAKDSQISQLEMEVTQQKKQYHTLMASPILANNLQLQKTVESQQATEIKLSQEVVQLTKENEKMQKLYFDLKTRTETTQDIEVSDLSGSVSTGGIACLSITAIGLVTAAFVMKDSKKRNSQKGSMYLLENEEI